MHERAAHDESAPLSAPKVSVIVPTFNRARDIGRCLDSLVAQSFGDFEVLVCDDGSCDNTKEIVDRYHDRLRLTYLWSENFGGPARPRNAGLRLAKGEYVAFLDSDDWWAPEKLAESIKQLNQGADIVYHDLWLARKHKQQFYWRKSRGRALVKPVFLDLLIGGNALNNSSVVAKRAVLRAAGELSEDKNLIAAEDYDYWLRIAKVSDAFVKIPGTLGYYWVGDGNLSNLRRTVTTTEALEAKYSTELKELSRDHGVVWFSYLKARCHYLLGRYDLAAASLAAMDSRNASLLVRAKLLWMKLRVRLHSPKSYVA